jgi:hypothetical protein
MSKNEKISFMILGLIGVIALAIILHLQKMDYDGFCTQCGNCSHPTSQVFPYTQYQCCECGNIDLGK